MHLMESDSLIAIYNVIPHFTVTVMVDQPYNGNVLVESLYSTNTVQTLELPASTPIAFEASNANHYEFKNWSSNHTPLGTSTSKAVNLSFTQNDTIVAHFSELEFGYYVPTSFTPNGDGVNDAFRVEGASLDAAHFKLTIYNRWGEKVFESTDPTKYWYGNDQGGSYFVSDEVYTYKLKVRSVFEDSDHELVGSILMIR